ncbi:hypothetical protein WP12_16755 [Sphingomonas sp. SRS2]|nr:hypothetical protein WP12_16755 [Sphingomonas sp. SRS2]
MITILYGQATIDGIAPGPTRRVDALLSHFDSARLLDDWRPGDTREILDHDLIVAIDCLPDEIYAHGWDFLGPMLQLVPVDHAKAAVASCSCHAEMVRDARRHGSCISGACPHVAARAA